MMGVVVKYSNLSVIHRDVTVAGIVFGMPIPYIYTPSYFGSPLKNSSQ